MDYTFLFPKHSLYATLRCTSFSYSQLSSLEARRNGFIKLIMTSTVGKLFGASAKIFASPEDYF
jgi:hypothetical protein